MAQDHSLPLFNDDFQDADFAEIDALVEHLQNLPRPAVSILNNERVQHMRFSYAMTKRVLHEIKSGATIRCTHHEMDSSVGIIRIEGVDIALSDMEGFARAAEFASNTEIYPLIGNKVRMTFTFHGIMTPTTW